MKIPMAESHACRLHQELARMFKQVVRTLTQYGAVGMSRWIVF